MLLPVRSVGVMGDDRTYQSAIAIRAVESADGMTADWARLPHDLLARISSGIVNEVRGINRVVYDISLQAAVHDRVGVAPETRPPWSARPDWAAGRIASSSRRFTGMLDLRALVERPRCGASRSPCGTT